MGYVDAKIEGLDGAIKILKVLPDALQRREMLKIFRKAVKPMIKAARQKVLSYGSQYSNFSKCIGTITGKSRNFVNIMVGPRVKGKWGYIGYIGHWLEYGTSGIITKKGRSWSKDAKNTSFAMRVGKIKKGQRYRADQPAKPYMRPAVDQTKSLIKSETEKAMAKYLQKNVEKTVSKLKRK